MRTWGNLRRWLAPDEARRRLSAKAAKLQAELRAAKAELRATQARAVENDARLRVLTTQSAAAEEKSLATIESLRFDVESLNSQMVLRDEEIKTLMLILKRYQAHEEHDAAIKLIDLEMAKRRVQTGAAGVEE